jgi:hypothetical protein
VDPNGDDRFTLIDPLIHELNVSHGTGTIGVGHHYTLFFIMAL